MLVQGNPREAERNQYLQLWEPFDGLERPENSQHPQRLNSLDVSAFVVSVIVNRRVSQTSNLQT